MIPVYHIIANVGVPSSKTKKFDFYMLIGRRKNFTLLDNQIRQRMEPRMMFHAYYTLLLLIL